MPYIAAALRHHAEHTPLNAGELNFALTRMLLGYIERKGLSYQTINDCVGALECAKLEAYARIARPYEQDKCAANGEVYFPA